MMRCLIVDDEKLALDLMEDNIRQVPFLQLVARCKNPLDAMEILNSESIDLIFLDIQMPGITGIQFLQSLKNSAMVVFVTAYEKYALEGYNLDVLDYLVKPVSFERFLKAANKALELFNLRNNQSKSSGEPADHPGYIFVSADYSLVKINIEDITVIEGLKDYIRIHLGPSAKPVITRMSMKAIEDKLPSQQFIRVHKSYIISIHRIASIRKGRILIDHLEIPISDNYREQFFKRIEGPEPT